MKEDRVAVDVSILRAMQTPQVHQIGVVVEDVPRAVRFMTDYLGIAPWYRLAPGLAHDIWYRGRKVDCELDLVLAFAGKIQIELITTQGDRNIYTEHLEKCGPGLHHFCSFVSDYQAKLNAYVKAGFEPIQRGHIVSKGGSVTDYAYFDLNPEEMQGLITEISSSRLSGKLYVRMTPLMMKLGVLTGDLQPVKY